MLFFYSKNIQKGTLISSRLSTILLTAAFCTVFGLYLAPNTASADSGTGIGAGTDISRNWSGYTASGAGMYTSVGSNWVVPQANSTVYSADAAWVGIGGIGKSDLIQVGTQALADDSAGSSFTYKAWYELLPSEAVTIPVVVKPGDSVSVSITQQQSNYWLISFQNITTGQNYQTTVYYVSSVASAEWIQEMPLNSGTNSFVPLDNFGTISFSNAWATVNNIKENIQQLGAQPMSMLNYSNQQLVAMSPLGADGSSFSVTRTSADAAASNLATVSQYQHSDQYSRNTQNFLGRGIHVEGVNVRNLVLHPKIGRAYKIKGRFVQKR